MDHVNMDQVNIDQKYGPKSKLDTVSLCGWGQGRSDMSQSARGKFWQIQGNPSLSTLLVVGNEAITPN